MVMTKDEAIHKALKVLNCLNNDRVYETAWVKSAINACEEVVKQPTVAELNDEYLRDTNVIGLEQPAEPRLVSYAPDGSTCTLNIDGEEVYFNREQPAQSIDRTHYFIDRLLDDLKDCNERIDELEMKEWQGLTDDEIRHCLYNLDTQDFLQFARAIEQALRIKNG